jgi:Ca2+-binding EF-hand superfamily protein
LGKLDPSGEGMVPTGEVLDRLDKKNIIDMQPSELAVLVNYCDKGNHGFIVLERFE